MSRSICLIEGDRLYSGFQAEEVTLSDMRYLAVCELLAQLHRGVLIIRRCGEDRVHL